MNGDTKLMKLIRRLNSPENDHEAVGALRVLAAELQAIGRGFQELADLRSGIERTRSCDHPRLSLSIGLRLSALLGISRKEKLR
jgi:hypothetical protein